MRTTVIQFGAGVGIMAALASIPSASAITFGQVDGDQHPNVCAVVRQEGGTNVAVCTCTLIAPTVVLTTARCGERLDDPDQALVTFDDVVDASSPLLEGNLIPHPNFQRRQDDPNNIAVIELSAPVEGIAIAELPEVGLLDDLKDDHELKGATFTAVGYGATGRQVGGGPPTFVGQGTRRFATMGFLSLTKAVLQTSQVPARGFGGTCVGDTGAPNFLGGADSNLVVAITYGGDVACAATNVGYRLDTANARAFLDPFLD
ncbi:trypsin-like serine protease [Sorangium sp. So ce1128]